MYFSNNLLQAKTRKERIERNRYIEKQERDAAKELFLLVPVRNVRQ